MTTKVWAGIALTSAVALINPSLRPAFRSPAQAGVVKNCSFRDGPSAAVSAAARAEINAGRIGVAARIDRALVTRLPYPERLIPDLESLSTAETIVVGTVVDCTGVEAKTQIDTLYVVEVEESIKGVQLARSQVLVEFPGGRIDYPDGTFAETRVPEFRLPQINNRLVVFLTKRSGAASASPAVFGLSVGQWSSLRLAESGAVEPSYWWSSSNGRDVATVARGMSASVLLQRLRDIVKKVP